MITFSVAKQWFKIIFQCFVSCATVEHLHWHLFAVFCLWTTLWKLHKIQCCNLKALEHFVWICAKKCSFFWNFNIKLISSQHDGVITATKLYAAIFANNDQSNLILLYRNCCHHLWSFQKVHLMIRASCHKTTKTSEYMTYYTDETLVLLEWIQQHCTW